MLSRTLALLLVVGVVNSQSLINSPNPEPAPEESPSIWPFYLITIILVMSIIFEITKEVIEHHTPKVFMPIHEAFFSELATLGFIGAIAFCLTYNFDSSCKGPCSVMQRMSENFLGEPDELQEVFEALHFMLFAISVVFICVILAMLSMTLSAASKYEELEQEINKATKDAASRRRFDNAISRRQSDVQEPPHSNNQESAPTSTTKIPTSPPKFPSKKERSKSPRKKSAVSPAASAEQKGELKDRLINFGHERQDRQEAEERLMQGDVEQRLGKRELPTTPTQLHLNGLLMWGSATSASKATPTKAWWVGTMLEHWFKPREQNVAEYYRLRFRFIDDADECVAFLIPHDFDFGDYLKKTLAHNYAHIIEISPLDWGILWGVMGLIFIIYYHFPELSILIFFGFELALGALSWIVLDKLTRIRAALVPSVAPGGGGSYKPPECCPASGSMRAPHALIDESILTPAGTSSYTRTVSENSASAPLLLSLEIPEVPADIHSTPRRNAQPKVEREASGGGVAAGSFYGHGEHTQAEAHNNKSLSAVTGVKLQPPPYLGSQSYQFNGGDSISMRLRRGMCGKVVNRHQSLFWCGANGKRLLMHAIKLLLFASVMNLAVFIVELRTAVLELPLPAAARYLVCLLAILLPLLTLGLMPGTMGYLNLVTSVETMKDEHAIVDVVSRQKNERQEKAKQVLKTLTFLLDQAAVQKVADDGITEIERDVHAQFEELKKHPSSRAKIQELKEVYQAFDVDGSGSIDMEELGPLLDCMGQKKSQSEIERLFNLMDADGSNDVDFEEFATVMMAEKIARKVDAHAIAEKIFQHFDPNGDGKVSPDEMVAAFLRIGKNWNVDDVLEFLREVDHDGSGSIEKDELIFFVSSVLNESNDHFSGH